MTALPALLPATVPVEPGSGEARRLLEQELTRPDYPRPSLLQRLLDWIEGLAQGAPGAGGGVGRLLLLLLLLALILGVLWQLRRVRVRRRVARTRQAGLTDPSRSAQDYLDEAARHHRSGAWDRATVAGLRALVVVLDDRDLVRDAPGRTAHEVATALGQARPDLHASAVDAADAFDTACYGHTDGSLPAAGDPQRTDEQRSGAVIALARAVGGSR